MLPRQLRVRKSQIPQIMTKGRSFFSPLVSLKVVASPVPTALTVFTVVVSAKVEPTAVGRNKIKRRLRHIIYKNKKFIKLGWQVVVLASPKASTALFSALEQDILYLLAKAGLSNK
ncbi:MAG: ribonuclease P protein component [Candidatus Vogelbacteria bacterium RIFOXYD1_FULL_44_32]|uniref:Ribonuclease P protein component n=1 Tax=Candidatus Vogelbacteria bacterium RIFOXYD1_FULL_44_32 TaxID=1802438 RepID=A0A1G2QEP3_9BACT|nr:MAG: ribonuclease P protein component [Candidatus Vogelbacteria bacterium RIFOXYD1_FULL_44_32]